MSEHKYCTTCKWSLNPHNNVELLECLHPKNVAPGATYEGERRYKWCTTMRISSKAVAKIMNLCGQTGRWWEPK